MGNSYMEDLERQQQERWERKNPRYGPEESETQERERNGGKTNREVLEDFVTDLAKIIPDETALMLCQLSYIQLRERVETFIRVFGVRLEGQMMVIVPPGAGAAYGYSKESDSSDRVKAYNALIELLVSVGGILRE